MRRWMRLDAPANCAHACHCNPPPQAQHLFPGLRLIFMTIQLASWLGQINEACPHPLQRNCSWSLKVMHNQKNALQKPFLPALPGWVKAPLLWFDARASKRHTLALPPLRWRITHSLSVRRPFCHCGHIHRLGCVHDVEIADRTFLLPHAVLAVAAARFLLLVHSPCCVHSVQCLAFQVFDPTRAKQKPQQQIKTSKKIFDSERKFLMRRKKKMKRQFRERGAGMEKEFINKYFYGVPALTEKKNNLIFAILTIAEPGFSICALPVLRNCFPYLQDKSRMFLIIFSIGMVFGLLARGFLKTLSECWKDVLSNFMKQKPELPSCPRIRIIHNFLKEKNKPDYFNIPFYALLCFFRSYRH